MRWGPYHDAGEATQRLSAYANAVYVRPVGIMWVCGGQSTWLRRPSYDYTGSGLVMLVRCEIAPPPQIRPTNLQRLQNMLASVETFAHNAVPVALTMNGVSYQQQQWLSKNIIAPIDSALAHHPAVKDGLVVVGDVAGVIAGTAALIGIFTVGGTAAVIAAGVATVVAGVACAFLLWEDAQHLWFTMRGDEAGRAQLEHSGSYQWIEAIAPWFTLPDLLVGGAPAFREAAVASRFSGRTGTALAARQTRSLAAGRELRETIAGGEAGLHEINIARAEFERRAHKLEVMQAMALRANRKLLLKRNNVVSTVGGAWGARQYYQEPPERAKPLTKEAMVREQAEQLAKAHHGPARPGDVDYLLAPSHPVPGAERIHLAISSMIVSQKSTRHVR